MADGARNSYAFAVLMLDRHNSMVLYGATRAEVARAAVRAEWNDWTVSEAYRLADDGGWVEIDLTAGLAAAETEFREERNRKCEAPCEPRWGVWLEGPVGRELVFSSDDAVKARWWAAKELPPPLQWTVELT